MRLRLLPLLLPCGLLLPGLPSARPADPKPAPVARLIDQLGSADFAEREAATRALDERGADALDGLRQAAAAPDPEVSRRAAELVGRIERRVEAARLLGPKRVRLVCRDTTVAEAVAELTQKTGYAIDLPGLADTTRVRRVTLDTGTVSFWEAFDQLCRKAKVAEPALLPDGLARIKPTPNPYAPGQPYLANPYSGYPGPNPYDPNPGRLALVDGEPPVLPTCYAGAVRVRSLPAHVPLPPLFLGTQERVLPLEVAAEPGVPWQGVICLRVTRAVDDRGQQLVQPAPYIGQATPTDALPGAVLRVWDSSGNVAAPQATDPRHVPVRLRLGALPAKVVRELQGVVTAQVQLPPEPLLQVDNVAEAVGQSVPGPHGGWLKVLDLDRDAGGVVRVHGQIVYPPSEEGPPGSILLGGARNQVVFFVRPVEVAGVPNVELRDARGQAFQRAEPSRGTPPADGAPHEFHVTFRPRPGQGAAAQLVWVGRRTLLVDVPFTLHDVPLP